MTIQSHDQFSDRLLQAARALPDQRISKLCIDGRNYYVKMAEAHASWRWRLQKGDPRAAFEREKSFLAAFLARGAAVPTVLTQDEKRIVLADHGTPLHRYLVDGLDPKNGFYAAGLALAKLHSKGLAHGRPSLRDLCWDGTRVTFLDLEAGAKLDATQKDKARDLLLLLHSALIFETGTENAAQAILQAYSRESDAKVWAATQQLARKLGWAEALVAPLIFWHQFRDKKRSEFRALRRLRRLVLRAGNISG